MVKDHSDMKPAAVTTWATLFGLASRDLLYAPSHTVGRDEGGGE